MGAKDEIGTAPAHNLCRCKFAHDHPLGSMDEEPVSDSFRYSSELEDVECRHGTEGAPVLGPTTAEAMKMKELLIKNDKCYQNCSKQM